MDAAAGIPSPRSHRPNGAGQDGAKSFLVGGGIASLAAAAFMVRDGGVPGESITILEGLGTVGGSLDGAGREIMAEVLGHLRTGAEAAGILRTCTCIPCMMPFITSQFMPRSRGDRPQVLPAGTRDLAFIGQFVELPLDVVFTVEYSIRSAQVAVHGLLGLPHGPPAVYQGRFDPHVLLRAFRALHGVRA